MRHQRKQDDPWLGIPAADYEAHMEAVGQSAALRDLFGRIYVEMRPARLAVLGCTTGADLALIDARVTELAVGVDLNPRYLDVARGRLAALGPRLHLVCADVTEAVLPEGPYELVHAALLLEYVEPSLLFRRAHEWLAPAGTLSVVTQEPAADLPAVSETAHDSLRALARVMTLRTADEIVALAEKERFVLADRRTVKLPSGKKLVSSLFDKARKPMDCRRARTRC